MLLNSSEQFVPDFRGFLNRARTVTNGEMVPEENSISTSITLKLLNYHALILDGAPIEDP